jgi:hypothetical protein
MNQNTYDRTKSYFVPFIPKAYIEWCQEEGALQAWWRKEPWIGANRYGGQSLISNMHVGDRFSLGKTAQIGIIYEQVWHLCGAIGEPDYLAFHIGYDIGGYWFEQRHSHMAEGYFFFIPTPEQLWRLGYKSKAMELLMQIEPGENIGGEAEEVWLFGKGNQE